MLFFNLSYLKIAGFWGFGILVPKCKQYLAEELLGRHHGESMARIFPSNTEVFDRQVVELDDQLSEFLFLNSSLLI